MTQASERLPHATPGAAAERTEKAPAASLVQGVREEVEQTHTQDLRLLRRLVPFVRPYLMLVITALIMMPITSGASLFQPYLIKQAVDAAVVSHSSQRVFDVGMLFAATIVVEFIARFGQTYTIQLAGQRAMADLRREGFDHAQRLHVSFFDRTPVGRVLTRITNDVDNLGELFASGAVMAIGDVLMLVGIVGFMLYIDWQLTLFALAAIPPLTVVVELIRRRAREAFRAIRLRVAQLNAYLSEQVQGIAVVQAFGREGTCAREYRDINAAYRNAYFRSIKLDALLYSVVEAMASACVAVVLWYAARRAGMVDDEKAVVAYIGTVVAFYQYIHRFFIPLRDLSTKYTIIQSSLAAAERIFEFLDVDEQEPTATQPVSRPQADAPPSDVAIAFDHVDFEYRPGHPVLQDVSFSIRRGESIAIVGATGAGKTTVTSLMLHLRQPVSGTVWIDGQPSSEQDAQALRRKFAVIPQDVFLFSGTVAENVALGADRIDEEAVYEVLRQVGVWDLVSRRPGGIHARVEERGSNFSAGERQLLAFARALYRDAPILILDEATANIDSETEARLQTATERVMHERTSIAIAHRLSTVRRASRILVFHQGRLVEQGSHDELLQRGQVYATLHRLHFAR